MLLGRRSLAIVPKDQEEILCQDGSWAVGGHQRQGNTPLVPSQVLDTITETFLRRKKLESEKTIEVSESIWINNVDREVESVGAVEVVKARNVDVRGQDNNTSEHKDAVDYDQRGNESQPGSQVTSPGTETSWSPTPEREAPRRDSTHLIQSQAIQETPILNLRPHAPNVIMPQLQPQSHIQVMVIDEDDEGEETPMEVELPQAHDQSQSRVNLESHQHTRSTPAMNIATQVMEVDTPPCAQPNQHIVPGTVLLDRIPPTTDASEEQKRHRRFKAYALATPVKPVRSSTSLTRLPNTSRLPEVDSSLSTSSSSLIPATCTQNSTAPPAPSLPQTTGAFSHNEPTSIAPPVTTIEAPASVCREISPPNPSNPYTIFASTYPSYTAHNGTLKNFIKACICLEYLQSERALREFLYDDFIRAFSEGYLTYVAGAREGQEALPAIEWFNMLQGEPEYRKMIVTRANLKSVLSMFPEGVARARRYISGDPGERENKVVEKVVQMQVSSGVQTPDMSPPGPAKLQRHRRTPPSPQLGSDAPVSRGPAPTSSVRSKGPRPSQYFERLASASKSGIKRKRPSDEQARLREHFRKKRAASALGSGSRQGS